MLKKGNLHFVIILFLFKPRNFVKALPKDFLFLGGGEFERILKKRRENAYWTVETMWKD